MAKSVIELTDLVGGSYTGNGDVVVADATHDSRQSGPDSIYIAVVGSKYDGHEFVADAVAAGSPAVCVSRPVDSGASAQVIVDDTRAAMGPLAAAVHDFPSESVPVVGVTGTNGKTTVTHYIESILEFHGRSPGLIGTVGTRLGPEEFPSPRTTPEATDFQRLLATMRDGGAGAIAAEVSSHALDLGRVSGTRFAVAAFTNLSQDHLDFHGDMKTYGDTKRKLFTDYDVEHAVVNIDDEFGARLVPDLTMPVTTVGRGGDVHFSNPAFGASSTVFTLHLAGKSREVVTGMIGTFNIVNGMIAAACCLQLGLGPVEVLDAMPGLRGVPGRFEVVSGDSPVVVIVDYAHTPDSIRAAIAAARSLTPSRVIAVFGAGGDRDTQKRGAMGLAAGAADVVYVTSDNPRSEGPDQIIAAVVAGVPTGTPLVIEPSRRDAINRAISGAESGDVVLIMGKGHETDQEIDGVFHPFVDRDVAREALGLESAESGSASGSMKT